MKTLDRIRIWIHIDLKCWIQIRIEINMDPKPCFLHTQPEIKNLCCFSSHLIYLTYLPNKYWLYKVPATFQ